MTITIKIEMDKITQEQHGTYRTGDLSGVLCGLAVFLAKNGFIEKNCPAFGLKYHGRKVGTVTVGKRI